MTEREVLDLLAERYLPPEWAFLRHVANGTGRHGSRTADALAMGLWPSRGLDLHGFEVKVWRGDWLREQKDPAKADEIASRCDRWWVVAGDDSVVQQDDPFPATWGLVVVRDGKLVTVKDAPPLAPTPLDRVFLAAILRRAAEVFCAKERTDTRIARIESNVSEENAKRLRARLDRLHTTANRIAGEIGTALYDLQRHERKAQRDDTEAA